VVKSALFQNLRLSAFICGKGSFLCYIAHLKFNFKD
jgi:hypothetical protein